jgi:hypothetical protein
MSAPNVFHNKRGDGNIGKCRMNSVPAIDIEAMLKVKKLKTIS